MNNQSIQRIQHIIHLADLHIGSGLNRSAEYRIVFDNLAVEITKIKDFTNNNPLIVIAGDIFHHKTRYSGEDVADFNYLLDILKDYLVVIIPGNHDANLYDIDRTDLLTPIVADKKNVLYFKQSGKYTISNLTFYHVSVFGSETAADIEALCGTTLTTDTILLYHGMITGAKMGNHTASEQRISRKVLDSVKLTIAGDIHQHQFITATCAYSGSLIQQNVAESINKGFLHWNLENGSVTTKFVPVANTCGFIRLDLRGKTDAEANILIDTLKLTQLDTIHKVRLLTDATSTLYDSQVKRITDTIGRLDSVAQTPIELNTSLELNTINPAEDIRAALSDLLTQQNTPLDILEEIVTTHCSKVKPISVTKWTVLELHWGNMFKYGTGNSIDFTQLNDISGVIANNMAGKSSIIDILVFALYGEHLRADAKSMIRNGTKTCYVRVKFSVSSDVYIIDRTDDSRKYTKLRLYKVDITTSNLLNITEQSNDATYRVVRELIGTLETFQTTGLYYDPNLDIVKMKSNARMTLLPELFGMADNESILTEVKLNIRSIKQQIDKLVKPRTADMPHALRDNLLVQIDANNVQVAKLQRKISQYTQRIESSRDYLRKVRNPELVARGLVKLESDLIELTKQFDSMGNIAEAPPTARCEKPTESIFVAAARQYTDTEEELSQRIMQLGAPPRTPANIEEIIETLTANINKSEHELLSLVTNDSVDIDSLNKQLAAGLLQIASCKMIPIDTKHIIMLDTQREKLASSSAFSFMSTCTCCENNKVHLANDLVTVERQLSAAKLQLDQAVAENQITNATLSKLNDRQCELQTKINAGIELYKSQMYKSKLEQAILTMKADLAKASELAAAAAEYKHRAAKLPALVKKRSLIAQINAARRQVSAYNLFHLYSEWLDYCNVKAKISSVHEQIASHKEELDAAVDYTTTVQDITSLTEKLNKTNDVTTNALKQGGILTGKLEAVNVEITIYDEYNAKYPPLSAELDKQKRYAFCLGSTGLRQTIVKRNIDKLVDSTNNILALVCNFKLAYNLDHGLNFTIIEATNQPPLSLGSGFQKFIISIAMRLALTSILPSSCQFIIIDEGFGCMDSQNIEQVGKLFAHISNKFKFTFIISHREQLQPIITLPLFINETTAGSYVTAHKNLIVTNNITALESVETKVEPIIDIPSDAYKCVCGIVVKKASKSAHNKTARHIKNTPV